MKRGWEKGAIFSFLLINFISLASASFHYGYGRFSLSGLFNTIEPATIVFFVSFLVFLAILHGLVFSKVFRDNATLSGITSASIAFLMSYGIYKWDAIDLNNLFFNLGLPSGIIYPIMVFLITILLILMIWKLKSHTLWILGLVFIGISTTDLIYEKGAALVIGIVLFILGILFAKKARETALKARIKVLQGAKWTRENYDFERERKQISSGWWMGTLGILVLIAGFITSQIWIIILGVIVLIVSMLNFRRNRNRPQDPFDPNLRNI